MKSYLVESGEMDPSAVRTSARGELEPISGDACVGVGSGLRSNAALVECLQPDRRVELTVLGTL